METRLDKLDKKDETENHPPISNEVFLPKMFKFKYCRVIAPHKDFVLLQRDPISFPRISNFSYLLTAYNATIYAMTLKTKNTCFTVENLRFVHAVRMITTTFLAVFSLFGWEMLKMFCSWENSSLRLSATVLCAVLNVNKLHMQVPSCTCISTTHAILVFNATGN